MSVDDNHNNVVIIELRNQLTAVEMLN